ncbi:MAG: 2-oxoacid:acceptor oxidoreductase family protein [Candidatus Methanoplasma sp.]|jgi:pyruvate ferredoxin oxidoreductase gamma subunit|nr:2-oxoacid:acceptor oxidoreductase family protein [Candidatus Methanoplasma sp.]
MTDVLWHGRGGQGAFTAARLLGASYVLQGGYALAFPSFGPERRGAPMRAFTKLDIVPVTSRCEIRSSDFTVYLDDTLLPGQIPEGTGRILVNSSHSYSNPRVVSFDASKLTAELTGSPIVNTAMLGALAALWDGITIEALDKGIEAVLPKRLWESNKALVRASYDAVGVRK